MGLRLVAQAGGQRQPLAHADVVLDVERPLQVEVVDVRIADPPRVAARPPGLERGQALERVGAEIVRRVVRVERSGVEPHAAADRVDAAHVIEIRREVDRPGAAAAGDLRAAAGERVVDPDGHAVDRRARRRVAPRILEPRVDEGAAAERSDFLNPERVVVLVAVVGAIDLVVAADAEVVLRRVVLVVVDAQRLVLGDGVVEHRVDVLVGARLPQRHRLGDQPAGRLHVEIRRVERGRTVQRDVERGAVLDQRAREVAAVLLLPLGPLDVDQRAAAGERAVAQVVAAAAAQRPDPRLSDDVDEQAAGAVVLRGERVARDVDRLDHRLGRQLAALEAVDADDAVAAGHVLQLLGHFGRIVRQRVDLLARQRGAERAVVAVGRRFLLVAADGHRILQTLDRQHDQLLVVVGAADAHVLEHAGIEAGKLRRDEISSGRQRDRRDPLFRRLRGFPRHRRGRLVEAADGDGGARQDGARLVHDGDDQPSVARRRLREQRRGAGPQPQRHAQRHRRDPRHFRTSNFFGSIFELIL